MERLCAPGKTLLSGQNPIERSHQQEKGKSPLAEIEMVSFLTIDFFKKEVSFAQTNSLPL